MDEIKESAGEVLKRLRAELMADFEEEETEGRIPVNDPMVETYHEMNRARDIVLRLEKEKLEKFEAEMGPTIESLAAYCLQNNIPFMFAADFVGETLLRGAANTLRGAHIMAGVEKLREVGRKNLAESRLSSQSAILEYMTMGKIPMEEVKAVPARDKTPQFIENDD